jgi:integrase
MPVKLTDIACQKLKYDTATSKVNDVTWDLLAPGLGLKVTVAGRKTWLMQAIWPGSKVPVQSRRVLGMYPGMSLDDARRKVRDWRDLIGRGIDPEGVARQHREAAIKQRATTFAGVAAEYIEARNNRKPPPRRRVQDAAEINRHLVSHWGSLPITEITPQHVEEVIGKLAARAPHTAVGMWSHASQIFKFAVFKRYLVASPVASLMKDYVLNHSTPKARERVLANGEIRSLWRAIDQLPHPECSVYRMLMLTGCRLSEASKAAWHEFDMADEMVWRIPADRFKTNKVHVLPITAAMLALLRSLPRNGDYVFSYDGREPMRGFSKLKAKVDRLVGEVPDWVNHDIRRTVRTQLSALKVPDEVAEAVIGHGRRGIQGVYDQHHYLPEKREALTRWHAHLDALVAG